jgi:nucleoside-diphosphate-sugar epimerase
MSSRSVIAITGASGFIGSALTEYFSTHGYDVVALVRNPHRSKGRPHVLYRAYDLAKLPESDPLKGVDYLIHTAYAKDSGDGSAFALNVEGTKQLLAASSTKGIRKNIFLSSLSAKLDADSVYGKQKLAVEKLFMPKNIVLRLGLVVGNGGLVRQTAEELRAKHVLPLISGGRQPIQYIGIEDVAEAVEAAITKDITGTYTIADPEWITYKAFYRRLAKVQHIRLIAIPVPSAFLMLVIRIASSTGLSLGITEDNLKGLKRMSHVETAKDMCGLGIHLTPLDQAFASIKLH